jgi:hypothetical protein
VVVINLERKCNGGPNGSAWCGKPATHVARGADGGEWFCCEEHTEGAGQLARTRLLALDVWLIRGGLHVVPAATEPELPPPAVVHPPRVTLREPPDDAA